MVNYMLTSKPNIKKKKKNESSANHHDVFMKRVTLPQEPQSILSRGIVENTLLSLVLTAPCVLLSLKTFQWTKCRSGRQ